MPLNQARQFRFRAEELRSLAKGMKTDDCAKAMQKVAEEYEALARQAEVRSANTRLPPH